jgi:hypothetical protein
MLIAKRDRLNWFVGDRDFVNIIKSLVVGCVVARRNAPDETNAIAFQVTDSLDSESPVALKGAFIK